MNSGDPSQKIDSDPILKMAMEEILRIQPRFSPNSDFARTGIGTMKSEGVDALKRLKEKEKGETTD